MGLYASAKRLQQYGITGQPSCTDLFRTHMMTLVGIVLGEQCVCFMCMCVSVVPTHSHRMRSGGATS